MKSKVKRVQVFIVWTSVWYIHLIVRAIVVVVIDKKKDKEIKKIRKKTKKSKKNSSIFDNGFNAL